MVLIQRVSMIRRSQKMASMINLIFFSIISGILFLNITYQEVFSSNECSEVLYQLPINHYPQNFCNYPNNQYKSSSYENSNDDNKDEDNKDNDQTIWGQPDSQAQTVCGDGIDVEVFNCFEVMCDSNDSTILDSKYSKKCAEVKESY